jgi:glycosyltransferase involved in cell wall biosynthesis
VDILFLSRWFPWPADNGSRLRVRALLRALTQEHDVDLISFSDHAPTPEQCEQARKVCRKVATADYRPFRSSAPEALIGLISSRPRSVKATHSLQLADHVERMTASRHYDLVIASEIDMVPYAMQVRDVPLVMEELELGVPVERVTIADSTTARLRNELTLWKLRRYVRSVLPHFAACTVVSDGERALLAKMAPDYGGIVEVVPNGVDLPTSPLSPVEQEPDLLVYSGSVTYSANLDAVCYFANEILPLIRRDRPNARMLVTGRTDGAPLDRIADRSAVSFSGYVDDVSLPIRRAQSVVVPLRMGGGTRLKVLEALALGTPVVATSKGIEGLDLPQNGGFLVADTPQEFAHQVTRLLSDESLRRKLQAEGPAAVAKYDWSLIGSRFTRFAEQVAVQGGRT